MPGISVLAKAIPALSSQDAVLAWLATGQLESACDYLATQEAWLEVTVPFGVVQRC